jgi:transcription elongation factor GreA
MPAAKQYKQSVQLTQQGYDDLVAELEELKSVKLPKVIKRVAEARAHGDLSENAEYTNSKEEQQFIESRISEIEDIINTAQIVKSTKSKTAIGMGSEVTVHIKGKASKTFTYHLVGEYEADPMDGKISIESPLGKALKGKKKGDEAKVKAPAGEITYVIKEIK